MGLAASACTAGDGNTAGTIVCDSTHGTPGGTTGSCTCSCAAGYGGIDCATGGSSMHRSLHALHCMHHPVLCILASRNGLAYPRVHACLGLGNGFVWQQTHALRAMATLWGRSSVTRHTAHLAARLDRARAHAQRGTAVRTVLQVAGAWHENV